MQKKILKKFLGPFHLCLTMYEVQLTYLPLMRHEALCAGTSSPLVQYRWLTQWIRFKVLQLSKNTLEYCTLIQKLGSPNPLLSSPSQDKVTTLHITEVQTFNSSVWLLSLLPCSIWTDWGPAAYQQTSVLTGHLQEAKYNSAINSIGTHYKSYFY